MSYVTLSYGVVTRIRDAIVSGRLKPGQKLEQEELARRFGTSRMPVRDALRRLEAEGLVRVEPGRGAFVSELDLEEFQQIYQVRAVLEEFAGRLAAPNISDEELAVLARLVEQMEEAALQEDLGAWLQLDRTFHNATYQACGNPILLKTIAGFWNTTQHFRRAYCILPGSIQLTQERHRQLLAALSARDGALFGRLAGEHILETIRTVLPAWRQAGGALVIAAEASTRESS